MPARSSASLLIREHPAAANPADLEMSAPPIRLLFFLRESYPTTRVDVDVLFARKLLERGHQIDFVMQAQDSRTPSGTQPWRSGKAIVGRTDSADGFLHRIRKHVLAFRHDLACLRLARVPTYEAVQVRDKFMIAALAAWVARRRGLRFFYWLSWPEPESQLSRARERSARYPFIALMRGHLYDWLLYRWILPRADHVFAQSEQMKRDLCARGVAPSKITPVPMGVELSDIPAQTREPGSTQGREIVIGYLGVITAERQLGMLVDMLAELRRAALPARLLFVGDAQIPADRRAIEDRARDLGLSDLMEITGFLPRAQALERILQSDVCVSPFYPTPILLSTSPTKLVEYLALGLPVIANNHPEQRLALQESRAGLCVPWGARHFARAVRWLAVRSPEVRREMGKRGRAWVEAHRTYDRIATSVEDAYHRALATPSK